MTNDELDDIRGMSAEMVVNGISEETRFIGETIRRLLGEVERLTKEPRLGESDEKAYERNERVMLAAAAEVERLKPIVGRPVGELPVEKPLEPYVTYHAWPLRREGGQHVGTPTTGVLAVHSSGVAAVSTDERSQMANKQAAMERVRQLLTANAGRQR